MNAVDLFAGPGGWDYAATSLGFDPLGIEWDDAACADMPLVYEAATAAARGKPVPELPWRDERSALVVEPLRWAVLLEPRFRTGGGEYHRCSGSGFRLARWPVGQRLVHHTGSVWEVIEDRGAPHGDYLIRCVKATWLEGPVGKEMVAHGEYLHRDGWRPWVDLDEREGSDEFTTCSTRLRPLPASWRKSTQNEAAQ